MNKLNKKMLKYIKKHPNCEIEKNSDKHKTAMYLHHLGYVQFHEGKDKDGLLRGHVYYSITNAGLDALASTQWFNMEYVLTHLLIPLLVGIIGSFIGAYFQSIF